MDLVVRPAVERDAPDLARLRDELAAEDGVGHRSAPDAVWALVSQPGAGALVAVADGRVVGMLTYFVYPSLMRAARWAQIAEVVVDASARRRGVGTALLGAALDTFAALGARDASVSTTPDNRAAASLYRAAGFDREWRTFERRIARDGETP